MVPENPVDQLLDPVELLNTTLDHVWGTIRQSYDVMADLPDPQVLFEGVDLNHPVGAAESIVASMLLEMVESVGRFSPWYTKPARAFGLLAVRDAGKPCTRWVLAPEAIQKWQPQIKLLADTIRNYRGLIRAALLVEDLMRETPNEPCITASCHCKPPRKIQIRRAVLDKTEIICDACMEPFR